MVTTAMVLVVVVMVVTIGCSKSIDFTFISIRWPSFSALLIKMIGGTQKMIHLIDYV